jgi:osmoprotectant transport system ATP-binding protein
VALRSRWVAARLLDLPFETQGRAAVRRVGLKFDEVATSVRRTMIRLEQLTKCYDEGRRFVVRDLNLEVRPGELLILVGESGSGKTTTLKMINRLVERSSGRILINGEDVVSLDPVTLRRRIGYVFQGIGLFPHMTVAENIGIVPRLLKWKPSAITARVDELLAMMSLPSDNYRNRTPAQLSGGQQQRVGVARALAGRPTILLMDEPFGALDPVTRDALQSEVKTLHRSLGLTVIMVTHDMTEALIMADRIAVMHQGSLLQVGTPRELLTHPNHPQVAALLEAPRRQAARLKNLIRQQGHESETE